MAPTVPLQRSFSLLLESVVSLEFLLPNGLLISMKLDSDLTLTEVKNELWESAAKEPLFDILQSANHYIFTGLNRETAEEEEFYNQSLRLCELPLLLPYLRVVEAAKDSALLEQNAKIASCIGFSSDDMVRSGRHNPEVKWARQRLLQLANTHFKALADTGSVGVARYLTAALQREPTRSLRDLLKSLRTLSVAAWVLDGFEQNKECRVLVHLDTEVTVLHALDRILATQTELARSRGATVGSTVALKPPDARVYLLKVCCSQEYLFDQNARLISYEYVQQCVEQRLTPCLSPVLLQDVCDSLSESVQDYFSPSQHRSHNNGRPQVQLPTGSDTVLFSRSPHGGPQPTGLNVLPAVPPLSPSPNMLPYHLTDSSATMNVSTATDSSPLYKKLEEQVVNATSWRPDGDVDSINDVDEDLHSVGDQGENCITSETSSCMNELSTVSLWKLKGYLCVQVRSAQISTESVAINTSSSNLSPATSSSSLGPSSTIHTRSSSSSSSLTIGQLPGLQTLTTSAGTLSGMYAVRVGLFHGGQTMIECKTTVEMPGTHLFWNKSLNFDIQLADIPPTARLCVALIKVEKTNEKRVHKTLEYPVGWANINLFDFRGFMLSGDITLNLWPASLLQSVDERFYRLNPSGTVLTNPTPDFTVQLKICNPTQAPIQRPSLRAYLDARRSETFRSDSHPDNRTSGRDASIALLINSMANPFLSFTNRVFAMNELVDSEETGTVWDETDYYDSSSSVLSYEDENNQNLCPTNLKELLRELVVTRDPLYELSEQEKLALWRGRFYCCKHLPTALPWITQTVKWHRRQSLIEFYHVLDQWPRPLEIGVALQLLGALALNANLGTENLGGACGTGSMVRGGASGSADAYVRELAVNSLHHLSDAELSDYLLQLVQSLKAEPYLDNALSRFILYRALRNPLSIGLQFFWHLRSELHSPEMRLRFGLLLEAFCHGCGPLLTFLSYQVRALNRLETISTRLKGLSYEEDQRAQFRIEVAKAEAQRDLQWLPSPVRLSNRLGELVSDKCDVKRSKKRPLWLVWNNADSLAKHHHRHHQLIFKHGDDLRQDMLTLQLLRVMDRIWKEEGMDMCLVPYGCLATGPEMGLIVAVRDARTVMSIQGERLRAALQIDSTQLHKWLVQQHTNRTQRGHRESIRTFTADDAGSSGRMSSNDEANEEYDQMIKTFTRSCAGYCVATFVLGIRDRHPDNIMVDTTGRLFHIDFGHILDNRKKKFGITRERVPFVLTKDFITVIARGNPDVASAFMAAGHGTTSNAQATLAGSEHFQDFMQLCGRAYLLLRRHANLLLTLLAMMLPSGLPELTSVCDLDYVRKTLAVEMDEKCALEYFNVKFNEAYYGAWTTKIDWFSHWMNT